MKVTHKVSFQLGAAFEQHTAEFVLEAEDVSAKSPLFGTLSLAEQMFLMNALVVIEGLLYQVVEGYLDEDAWKSRKSRVFSMLSPKLREIAKSLIGEKNGNN